MNKSKFSKKKFWPFITTIVIPTVALFDYFLIKTGLSKLLLDTMKELTFMDIILLLILALISGIYIWVFLLNKKVNPISDKNIKEILNKNQNLIKINDELRDTCNRILSYQEKIIKENKELKSEVEKIESTEPDLEIYFILETLANQSYKHLEEDLLWALYNDQFENKERSDFQIVINDLKEKVLICDFEGEQWKGTFIEITSEGFKHLKVLKKKIEENKSKGDKDERR